MNRRSLLLLLAFVLAFLPLQAYAQDDPGLLAGLTNYWPLDETTGQRLDVHGIADLTDHNTVGAAGGVRSISVGAWWLSGGISETIAIAAYDPVTSSSLDSSYIDKTGNGNNLTTTSPPGLSGGWSFSGSQYLISPIYSKPGNNQNTAILIRFSNIATAGNCLVGVSDSNPYHSRSIHPNRYNSVVIANGARSPVLGGTAYNSGVIGFSGNLGYYNNSVVLSPLDNSSVVTSQNYYIGACNKTGSPNEYALGIIQAVSFYDGILTADQVQAVTDAMNELGQPTGAALFTADNYEYLDTTDAQTGPAFTIAGWVQPTTITTATQTIASQPGRFWIGYDDTGYTAEIYQNTTTTTTITLDHSAPITTTYNLIALTYDGTSASLYVDDLIPVTASASLTGTITNTLYLGADVGPAYYLDGALDEWGLWSYSLEPDTIIKLYNDGAGLLYEELESIIVNSDPSIFTVNLPSGGQGVISLSATAGELAIFAGLAFVAMLIAFWVIKDIALALAVKTSAEGNK